MSASNEGYYVRCVTCGDHYWRHADEDEDLVCPLCREEQAKHEAMRQQQGELNMTPEEIEYELAHCTGTTCYRRFGITRAVATDGAIRMAELCGAYWLLDAIASHIPNAKKLCGPVDMQFWTLRVDTEHSTAILYVSDGNKCTEEKVQKFEHTDFPLSEVQIRVGFEEVEGGALIPILCLPSED